MVSVPEATMKFTIISPNLSGCVSILDMGVTYLATYINERTRHTSNIIDYTFRRKYWRAHLLEKLNEFKPDCIGITTVSLFMGYVRSTIRAIREEYSRDVPIVLGGYHATLSPDESLSEEGVNAVCIGDGEYAMQEYLDTLEQGKSPDGIAGIWYRENGRIVRNPKREYIHDIDSLPLPDYDLWDHIDTYFYFIGQLWFIGTRGCPYKCTNCSEYSMRKAVPGKRYRTRDPKGYVDEIKQQWEKYGSRGMRMAHAFDAVFTFDKKWLIEFCDEYKRRGMAGVLPFSVFTRGDTADEEKAEILAAAGCREVRVGIEAGSDRVRNEIYEKDVTTDELRRAVRAFKNKDIVVIGYNMLGGPSETKEELWQTYCLNKELDVNKPVFFIYRPLPKTEIIGRIEGLGSHIKQDVMDGIDTLHWGAAVESPQLSAWYVEYFQKRCFLYFVPRRMFRLIRKQKLRFFVNLARYMYRGWKYGADMKIVFAYFLASCGDNLTS